MENTTETFTRTAANVSEYLAKFVVNGKGETWCTVTNVTLLALTKTGRTRFSFDVIVK